MMRALAKLIFALRGWKIVGDAIPVNKSVIVVAYHTSNWDAIPCLGANLILRSDVKWMGKASIFRWPLGVLLRYLGGVPVHREERNDLVAQMVAHFSSSNRFVLAIAPEGTRKRAARWKSGFYNIALQAGVPLQPAALDYQNRKFVFGPLFMPTGNYPADLRKLREFFRPFVPKNPDWADKDFAIPLDSE